MKMVLESIEGEIARLIPDNPHLQPQYVSLKKMPKNSAVGDVFEVEVDLPSFKPVTITRLENEREKRMKRMKKKREQLLQRSKNQLEE